jgi:predicted GNAT family acetyltransferase
MWFPVHVSLSLVRHHDPRAFLARVEPFLGAREAEHNLLFGILDALDRDPTFSEGPPYLAAIADGDRVVAVALRTPPNNLVLSEVDDPDAVAAIVDDVLAAGDALPGAIGPVEPVRALAQQWTARTGQPHRRLIAERAFRLSTVIAPRPAEGAMRVADIDDFTLLMDWLAAFAAEALPEEERRTVDAEPTVRRWLGKGTKTNYLWETDGRPVSWAGVGGRTPHGTRIGPVYTPPEHRGRGYASALVAAASQAQLDAGLAFCFLFTDLANPTSNRIYQAIGYEPVTDVEVYAFG